MPKIVNYYTSDKKAMHSRLYYIQQNYLGVEMSRLIGAISLHDTNIDGHRRVIIEYHNRKEILYLTTRRKYEKTKQD